MFEELFNLIFNSAKKHEFEKIVLRELNSIEKQEFQDIINLENELKEKSKEVGLLKERLKAKNFIFWDKLKQTLNPEEKEKCLSLDDSYNFLMVCEHEKENK